MRVEGSASDCSGSHSARFSSSAVGRLTATVSLLVTVAVAVLVVVDLWALTAGAQGAQDSEAATDVSAGGAHTCAVLADGSVWCWGSDDAGRLGDGIVEEPLLDPVPSRVVGIDDAVAISAGSAHSCAVLVDGSVWCWGFGMGGQLGNGRAVFDAPAPVQEEGNDDADAVTAGGGVGRLGRGRTVVRGVGGWLGGVLERSPRWERNAALRLGAEPGGGGR